MATVTVPSTVTRLPSRWRARAIVRRGAGAGEAVAVGEALPEARGDADGLGDVDVAGAASTSCGSRTQRRYPSNAPLREARWPTMPVRVAATPLRSTDVSRPADPSAITRSDVPSMPRIVKVMSPLVALVGPAVIVPLTRDRRPSVASATAPASIARGAGRIAVTDDREAARDETELRLAVRGGDGATQLDERAASRRDLAVGEAHREAAGLVADREEAWRSQAPGLGDDHATDRGGPALVHEARRADRERRR